MELNSPKDVFLYIAEAYDTPYEQREDWQRQITSKGICYAIFQLYNMLDLNILVITSPYLRSYNLSQRAIESLTSINYDVDMYNKHDQYWLCPIRDYPRFAPMIHDALRRDVCILLAYTWEEFQE